MQHWRPAYIGVGSNLEDPAAQVQRALAALGELPQTRAMRASPLYRSKPLGDLPQPDYINAVAALLTELEPQPFFQALRALETQLGREPVRAHWGPRRIDLDLLVFAGERIDTPELQLPHPGIVQRNFVLYPLADVAPDLVIPGRGPVLELARQVASSGIWRLDNTAITHGA